MRAGWSDELRRLGGRSLNKFSSSAGSDDGMVSDAPCSDLDRKGGSQINQLSAPRSSCTQRKLLSASMAVWRGATPFDCNVSAEGMKV